jgi:hypothetical protein
MLERDPDALEPAKTIDAQGRAQDDPLVEHEQPGPWNEDPATLRRLAGGLPVLVMALAKANARRDLDREQEDRLRQHGEGLAGQLLSAANTMKRLPGWRRDHWPLKHLQQGVTDRLYGILYLLDQEEIGT